MSKKIGRQLDKDEVLRRYFLISYEVIVRRFYFFRRSIRGQLSAHTTIGKYMNKELLCLQIPKLYPKNRVLSIVLLNIQELRRPDYEEYGMKFNPDGTPVKLTKPVPLHKDHRNR